MFRDDSSVLTVLKLCKLWSQETFLYETIRPGAIDITFES